MPPTECDIRPRRSGRSLRLAAHQAAETGREPRDRAACRFVVRDLVGSIADGCALSFRAVRVDQLASLVVVDGEWAEQGALVAWVHQDPRRPRSRRASAAIRANRLGRSVPVDRSIPAASSASARCFAIASRALSSSTANLVQPPGGPGLGFMCPPLCGTPSCGISSAALSRRAAQHTPDGGCEAASQRRGYRPVLAARPRGQLIFPAVGGGLHVSLDVRLRSRSRHDRRLRRDLRLNHAGTRVHSSRRRFAGGTLCRRATFD
jgi:hypothetical protein